MRKSGTVILWITVGHQKKLKKLLRKVISQGVLTKTYRKRITNDDEIRRLGRLCVCNILASFLM